MEHNLKIIIYIYNVYIESTKLCDCQFLSYATIDPKIWVDTWLTKLISASFKYITKTVLSNMENTSPMFTKYLPNVDLTVWCSRPRNNFPPTNGYDILPVFSIFFYRFLYRMSSGFKREPVCSVWFDRKPEDINYMNTFPKTFSS